MVLLSFPKRFRLAEAWWRCHLDSNATNKTPKSFIRHENWGWWFVCLGLEKIILVVGTKPGRPWSWIKGRSAVAALWCGIPVWSLHTAACLSLRWWPDVSAAQRVLWSFSFFLFIIRTALDLPGASSYDTHIIRTDDPTAPLNTHTCQMDMGMHHVGRSRTLCLLLPWPSSAVLFCSCLSSCQTCADTWDRWIKVGWNLGAAASMAAFVAEIERALHPGNLQGTLQVACF